MMQLLMQETGAGCMCRLPDSCPAEILNSKEADMHRTPVWRAFGCIKEVTSRRLKMVGAVRFELTTF
jgi:hypothetical protein